VTSPTNAAKDFDPAPILASLKDFQRRTVEHVYDRMYGPGGVDRFLVADEVGLGKTLVAKGIIAKVVEALNTKTRIDIVYLCANRDIAAQNIDRLNVFDEDRVSEANRLTLLPLYMKELRTGHNFIAFTPGTALDLGGSTGIKEERALLYWLVRDVWSMDSAALKNLFQVAVTNDNWDRVVREMRDHLADLDGGAIDAGVLERFKAEMSKAANLRQRLDAAVANFQKRREKPSNVPREHRQSRDELIGELRECLARACLSALEPDLIILDEFQRFKALLATDETIDNADDKEVAIEVADLGRRFLAHEGAKILLLSATPYKPYTNAADGESEDHYKDFLKTAAFLLNDPTGTLSLKKRLTEFNEALFDSGPHRDGRLQAARKDLEDLLRRHMVRTERLAVSADRDGMIEEVPLPECRLGAADLKAFATIDTIARQLEQPDVLEYWKSAPYFLNFMERDGYVVKKVLLDHLDGGGKLKVEPHSLRQATLSADIMGAFRAIDPQNARLRALAGEILDRGAWKILWLPPTVQYYRAPGAYHEAAERSITKVLVFSNWRFVPRAVAAMLSYEAERRIIELAASHERYDSLSTRARRGLLRFSLDPMGQPRDLNHLIPLYPSPTLCELIDPLEEAKRQTMPGGFGSDALLKLSVEKLHPLLGKLAASGGEDGGREDQNWYIGAPSQADHQRLGSDISAWLADEPWWTFKEDKDDDTPGAFRVHVQALTRLARGRLGRKPADLERVLAKAAIGAPAIVALRSLARLARAQGVKGYPTWLLECAAQVGAAFRTLFNQPDAMLLTQALYGGDESRYWEAMLDHCIAGNLQAVMDEHVHILREAVGVGTKPIEDAIGKIADTLIASLSLRATILRVDDLRADPEVRLMQRPLSIRCRSALRFDNDPGEAEGSETRAGMVRVAFNSPFRPFVMATTKVGQEGLDFHLWCHSVFHWHLPPNPVDFEQREGRVHRYKGHVIRKSVASTYAASGLETLQAGTDLWEHLFKLARDGKEKGKNDVVPYWIFKGNGEYKIRRYVPALPLSKERVVAERLRASLGVYRLVFGQARQEDLLAFLRSTRNADELDATLYAVNLAPDGN